ncbi:Xaa-Pro peptidase family protein [Chloroflexi bacterium TSY]|nr:Xaa-Pro peptidase family protein [Chloroflexi bacterium TSY]
MTYVDIDRARSLIAQHDLDGLLVVSPENFEYFAGVPGFPVTMWRRAGPASALLTAGGKRSFVVPDTIQAAVQRVNDDAQILSHPLWIEAIEVEQDGAMEIDDRVARATAGRNNVRPETFDWTNVESCLQQAMDACVLSGKRVGVELEFAPAQDFTRLSKLFPTTEFVNSSPLIRELRLLKNATEIDLLRYGVQLSEYGIMAALEHLDGQTIALDIRARFHEAVYAAARDAQELGFESARTSVHLGPALWGTGDPLRPAQCGDLIQFDSGVQILGYKTDIGRTFTVGPATDAQRRIQDALLAGYEAGLAKCRPSQRFCDVFYATQGAVRAAGFPTYARGHFGHSIGSDIDGEEWPRICADEQRVLEPGMVLAFEVPYYINGIGGFQNEDDILITEDGYESFNRLPIDLVQVEI